MARVSPDFVILGLLEVRPSHGYHLLEHFRDENRLGGIWKLSPSRIYALLKRLENQQYIDGREEDAIDAPMRTVYWLTPTGRDVLYDWLDDTAPSASTRNIRTEFLSRLYIATALNRPIEPIITVQRETCLARLEALRDEATMEPGSVGAMAIRLQIEEMQIIVKWLDTCRVQMDRVLD